MTDTDSALISGALLGTALGVRGVAQPMMDALSSMHSCSRSSWSRTFDFPDDPTEPLHRPVLSDEVDFADVVNALSNFPEEAIDRLLESGAFGELDQLDADDVDDVVWGPSPTPVNRVAGKLWDTLNDRRWLNLARDESLPVRLLARVSKRTMASIKQDVADREISGFSVDGELRIPLWQLNDDYHVYEITHRLIETFAAGPISLTAWMHRPHAALGGLKPVDVLRKGEGESLLALAGPSDAQW